MSKRPGTFGWSVRGDAWSVSAWRLALGIIGGAITFGLADGVRYGVNDASGLVSGSSAGITFYSDVIAFIQSPEYFYLVGALIVVQVVHNTIRKPFTVRGPIKMVYGALIGAMWFFLLAGGMVDFKVGVQNPVTLSLFVSISLLITLGLLEASAGLRVLQGLVEFFEGMSEAEASLNATFGDGKGTPASGAPSAVPAGSTQTPAAT
ncbi:MAG: hypothetical protein JRN21_05390 [Nitrososphaerota archaeon]|nr:hypothetical protein [Nitrososphaerota archaeon]